jgi:hypothetical protein
MMPLAKLTHTSLRTCSQMEFSRVQLTSRTTPFMELRAFDSAAQWKTQTHTTHTSYTNKERYAGGGERAYTLPVRTIAQVGLVLLGGRGCTTSVHRRQLNQRRWCASNGCQHKSSLLKKWRLTGRGRRGVGTGVRGGVTQHSM